MAKKETKTNVQRILENEGIPYEAINYECAEFTDGADTARHLGEDPQTVYKTIVTVGKSGGHFVFILPVEKELDMKKAAKAVGEKALELLPLKELTPLTGYMRGGCTAVGMKKPFPVVMDESAILWDYIHVSGGRIGTQLKVKPEDWLKAAGAAWGDITAE